MATAAVTGGASEGPAMKCPKCGKEVDDRKWFCSACNEPLHLEEDIFVPEVEVDRAGKAKRGLIARGFRREDPAPDEAPDSDPARAEFMFRGRFRRSWLIRLLVTLLILAILIAALLLIAHIRKANGEVTSAERSAAPIGRGPSSKEGQRECCDHDRDHEHAVCDVSCELPCPHVRCEARDIHGDSPYPP